MKFVRDDGILQEWDERDGTKETCAGKIHLFSGCSHRQLSVMQSLRYERSGVYVRTDNVLKPGSLVSIRLSSGSLALELKARVKHGVEGSGWALCLLTWILPQVSDQGFSGGDQKESVISAGEQCQ